MLELTVCAITHEVAVVVGVAAVIGKEAHRVALDNVLRVILHPLLGALPQSGDSLDVLVQRKSETVLLLVVGHEFESVVVNVAEELNAGLNTPVPLVIEHQGVAEEEAGLVATHVSVTDRVSVDDFSGGHVGADLGGLVLVNPLGERPMLLGDFAILCVSGSEGRRDLLELVVERLVIQEDPVVVEFLVEAVLDLTNGTSNLPDIRVASKSDKGGVHARTGVCCGRKTGVSVRGGSLVRGRLLDIAVRFLRATPS